MSINLPSVTQTGFHPKIHQVNYSTNFEKGDLRKEGGLIEGSFNSTKSRGFVFSRKPGGPPSKRNNMSSQSPNAIQTSSENHPNLSIKQIKMDQPIDILTQTQTKNNFRKKEKNIRERFKVMNQTPNYNLSPHHLTRGEYMHPETKNANSRYHSKLGDFTEDPQVIMNEEGVQTNHSKLQLNMKQST